MSQIGTFVVKPDVMTNTLTIRLPGDGVSVPTEEVVQHLGSDGLAPRTRRRIHSVEPREVEGVVTFRVSLTEPFRGFEQLDLEDAMAELMRREEFSCV